MDVLLLYPSRTIWLEYVENGVILAAGLGYFASFWVLKGIKLVGAFRRRLQHTAWFHLCSVQAA